MPGRVRVGEKRIFNHQTICSANRNRTYLVFKDDWHNNEGKTRESSLTWTLAELGDKLR